MGITDAIKREATEVWDGLTTSNLPAFSSATWDSDYAAWLAAGKPDVPLTHESWSGNGTMAAIDGLGL